MPRSDKLRRPGYAPPANATVGRRGLYTRDRIMACAAEVFLANGYHSTSIDAIAKAACASRATVYQYFADKEDIFLELSRAAERAVLDHGERMGQLEPTADGLRNLNRWLHEWADIYDAHAAVFAEFPGIGTGTGLAVVDTGSVVEKYRGQITERLLVSRALDPDLDPAAAAAALMRLPHMVNLYRYRAMFPLPSRAAVSTSLAITMQLMLFPGTPDSVIREVFPHSTGRPDVSFPHRPHPNGTIETVVADLAPIRQDVLSASSQLFAEHGYYAVSMEDIAAAADIGRATLYRYFGSKDKILADLTRRAVIEADAHAAALYSMANDGFDLERFSAWMVAYVRFHRGYRGVIRAWFDGTVAEQLSGAAVGHGIASMHGAVMALLAQATLPRGIDPAVAAAVFLAILGRMTEPTGNDNSAEQAADLMARLVRRSLLRSA